jgi:RHS repeat-associated protein
MTTEIGEPITDYVYVYAGATPLAQLNRDGLTDTLTYLHTDHLNTPQLATNPSGIVVWRWDGGAFGESVPNNDPDGDGNLTTVNLRYPGQYFDSETGLHYWGARYYDPKTGRGLSPDRMSVAEHAQRYRVNMDVPGQPPLELNPYAYVANNPLRWVDPTGLDILCGNGFTSITDPSTNIVKCIPYHQEPPQCVSGECANVFPPATNSQCTIKCMIEDAPPLIKGACKIAKDPMGGAIARKACEEYAKALYCSAKCDKEIANSCPTKK